MPRLLILLSLGLTVGLGACSTADYSKPVNDFGAATAEADATLRALNTQAADAYTEMLTRRIVEGQLLPLRNEGDCFHDSTRCRLMVIDEHEQKVEDYPPDPPLAQTVVLMSQVNSYAANLRFLVEADTANQVAVQVNSALGSIQNLAETIASINDESAAHAATTPQFATSVGAAVNWLVGEYVASVKLRGLQYATARAKPVIRDAANLFITVSEQLSAIPREQLSEEVSIAADRLRQAMRESNSSVMETHLKRLQSAAATYDALLTATPPEVFKLMGDAHDALADSLQGKNVTFAEAVAQIEAFAAEVDELAQILKDLRAITPEDGES